MAAGVPEPDHASPVGAAAETLPTAGDEHAGDASHPGGEPAHGSVAAAAHLPADEHASGHDESLPGPVDWGAWLVSAVGVGAGAAVALVLFAAIQHG